MRPARSASGRPRGVWGPRGRRLLLLALAGAAACAAPRRPLYAPEDPLSGAPRPEVFRAGRGEASRPVFRAIRPEGYRPVAGRLGAPMAAMLRKEVYGGEAVLLVERYSRSENTWTDRARLLRELDPAGAHAGKGREALHGLLLTRFTPRLSSEDPYANDLGRAEPPRLGLGDARFPKGGQAFRLYRCRRLGAWRPLDRYRRARRRGRLEEFLQGLPAARRKIVTACFGHAVIHAMEAGAPVPDIPRPSHGALKEMAREERERGAVRTVERECVHTTDLPDGFLVARFRTPEASFELEHPAFELFLSAFEPIAAP